MYRSRGYAVLYLNPRGSSGYGQKFADGCIDNWGGVDYEDLMVGVDHVLKTHPSIDPDRMVVTGGSYGGFMTNWIVTQTGRFRAAATREGMSNLLTDAACSLYWNLEYIEFGAPWLNYEKLMRWSPIRHVASARTPTLIIHGDRDNEVALEEAEQMYQGLKLQNVETMLVIYPGEGHGFHEPRHRVDAYERMLAWFQKHLDGERRMDQKWR